MELPFSGNDAYLTFLLEFKGETESEANPLPCFFPLRAFNDFVGDDPDELLLCPVQALRIYLEKSSFLLPSPRSLFRFPCNPSHHISKNAVSLFLREVISKSYNSSPDPGPSVRIVLSLSEAWQPLQHSLRIFHWLPFSRLRHGSHILFYFF